MVMKLAIEVHLEVLQRNGTMFDLPGVSANADTTDTWRELEKVPLQI